VKKRTGHQNLKEEGATAVITHRVNRSQQPLYEQWVDKIYRVVSQCQGFLDGQMIRPVPGITETYTVIIRFDEIDALKDWMESAQRKELIDEVRPLLVGTDKIFIQTGLEFWFSPETSGAGSPKPWKQWLVTWSAIYPLVVFIPMLVSPLVRALGIQDNRYIEMLVVTGIMVSLMVYFVMPAYTRLIRRWLFK